MKREEYEERMKDSRYRDLVVTNCESGKDYVFISYRGDSWRMVLTEIVYKLQKKYGLRVYFDKGFASENNIWIEQFMENMDSYHCKACLCFFDEGYVTSYATLLELMHAMNPKSKLKDSVYSISFQIDWEKLNKEDWNTGLGKDDQNNPGWKEEEKAFKYEFKIIKKKYPDVEDYYDCDNDEAKLRGCDCKEIMNILQPKNRRDYMDGDEFYEQFIVEPLGKKCPEVFEKTEKDAKDNDGTTNEGIKSTLRVKDGSLIPKQEHSAPLPTPTEGYKYTIFGKEYTAGKGEQGKLMFDAFQALVKRYPGCAEQLTQRTSIAKAENVKNPNTSEAYPTYFKGCKAFEINGQTYLVGTSYGFKAKIAEVKGMFKICGADMSEFILNGEPLGVKGFGNPSGNGHEGNGMAAANVFEYELWNIPYIANSLADMMHDVFDLIAEKFPDRIPDMADNDSITSVARKDDVKNENLPPSKLNYFKIKREHLVSGITYYVSASYNQKQGVGQLKKMLVLCEGNSDGFKITKAPEKSVHSSGKSEKKGIGELFDE